MGYVLLTCVILLLWWLGRVSHHSGVSKVDRQQKLAGDEIVPTGSHTIDRATVLGAPAATVWPWLVQLGKGRAGWYAPRWIEWFVPAKKRGLRTIDPALQTLQVGEVHNDWGPGSLQVLDVQKDRHIIYGSVKGKGAAAQPDSFLFSWALLLEPLDDTHCRLYIRLRFRKSKHPALAAIGYKLGGFFDYLTIVAMFAGLKQRVRPT